MRTALERGAKALPKAASPAAARPVSETLLLGSTAILGSAAVLFGGGSGDSSLTWIGAGSLGAAGAALAAALWGLSPLPVLSRPALAFFAVLGAFVLWNGISVLWSIAPDRSWAYFNRGLVYLAFAVLGLFVGATVPRAYRGVAAGLALLLGIVVAWALAGKVVPSLFPDGARRARLREPLEYWNALALAAAFALPLALWLASRRRHLNAARAGGALLLYAATVTLVLTYSRGGIAVALAAVALWLLIGGGVRASLAAIAVAAPLAAGVLAWAFTRPGIVADVEPYSTRVHDGAWFGVVFGLGGALACASFLVALRYEERWPLGDLALRPTRRALAVAAAAAAILVAGVAAGVPGPGNWLRDAAVEFVKGEPVSQESSRLTTLSSNNRWAWWGEAWDAFEGEPLGGTGAGSFRLTHRLLRDNAIVVTEPHNLPLQFLSELGLIGFVLAAVAVAAAALGVVTALRAAQGEERAAAGALAVVPAVYLLHGLVDFDWDFVAVSAPSFLVLGVLLGAGRSRATPQRRPLWALAVALLAVAAVASLAAPWIADRKVGEAYAALETDPGRAADSARRARTLNPLSIEPIFALAGAEHSLGNTERARELYVEAVELQPLNPETWYQLGAYELALRDAEAARRHLGRSHELDPRGPAGALLAQLGRG